MSKYNFKFCTTTVGVNAAGIHALREGVIRSTIAWEDVHSVRIQRNWDYERWRIMLILSAVLILAGFATCTPFFSPDDHSLDTFTSGLHLNFYGLTVMGLGALVLVLALRRTMVLEVVAAGKSVRFSLRDLVRRDQLRGFTHYLRERLPHIQVEVIEA